MGIVVGRTEERQTAKERERKRGREEERKGVAQLYCVAIQEGLK